jgi:hypothetical protein
VLLPALALAQELALGWIDVLLAVGLFFVGVVVLSPLLHKIGIRERPY